MIRWPLTYSGAGHVDLLPNMVVADIPEANIQLEQVVIEDGDSNRPLITVGPVPPELGGNHCADGITGRLQR